LLAGFVFAFVSLISQPSVSLAVIIIIIAHPIATVVIVVLSFTQLE
jgi:hypothetical protein